MSNGISWRSNGSTFSFSPSAIQVQIEEHFQDVAFRVEGICRNDCGFEFGVEVFQWIRTRFFECVVLMCKVQPSL